MVRHAEGSRAAGIGAFPTYRHLTTEQRKFVNRQSLRWLAWFIACLGAVSLAAWVQRILFGGA
jgi:hypothetical protein